MILSCITMLIDHVGCVFFSDSPVWRIIGRLAMPIYAYFIATGYTHTSDIGRYIKRIALIAIISQLPFMLLFDIKHLNICFAWLFSLLIIYGIDKKKYHILAIGLVLPIPALLTISIDYSLYGIIIPVLFYIRNKTNVFYKDIAVFMLIGIIAIPLKSAVQLFAIFSVPIILMAEKFKCIRTSNKAIKQCYRCFYPAHMIFLLIIKSVIAMT